MFLDDTSIIVSNQDNTILEANVSLVFSSMMKWFHANILSLNIDKTYIMEFYLKDTTNFEKKIICNNKIIPNTLSWNSHIDMITLKLKQLNPSYQ